MKQNSKRRQTRKRPRTSRNFLDSPTLSSVVDLPSDSTKARLLPEINTRIASPQSTILFLDRFEKEVVAYLGQNSKSPHRQEPTPTLAVGGDSNSPRSRENGSNYSYKGIHEYVKVGTNQCLRLLENCLDHQSNATPLLIVAVCDMRPATLLANVPPLAIKLGIPLLLLPDTTNTSRCLGKSLGLRRASIVCICQVEGRPSENERLRSFASFVSSTLHPDAICRRQEDRSK